MHLDPIESVVIKSEMIGDKNIESIFLFKFSYFIDGNSYFGYLNTFGLQDFKAFVGKYPIGSRMEIYVSPRKQNFVMHSKPSVGGILFKIVTPLMVFWLFANYFILVMAQKNT